jgi:hypothetical protein
MSFSMEKDFGEKEMQQRRSEEQTGMAHVAICLGRVGPTCSHVDPPMQLIFVLT